jgi:GNAT superfamily N-acetyltransferase
VPTLRRATAADLPALRTVCALAYRTNPLMRWVLPDDATRADACAAWLGPSLERYVAHGRVDVAVVGGAVVGLAAWRPAGVVLVQPGSPTTLPSPTGVLRALVGAARADQVLTALGRSAPLAPETPGAYLNYLAVHPDHQGRGLGGTLLRAGLEALRGPAAGTSWLATSDPRNLAFYARHGCTRAGAVDLAPDGPTLTVLHVR